MLLNVLSRVFGVLIIKLNAVFWSAIISKTLYTSKSNQGG